MSDIADTPAGMDNDGEHEDQDERQAVGGSGATAAGGADDAAGGKDTGDSYAERDEAEDGRA